MGRNKMDWKKLLKIMFRTIYDMNKLENFLYEIFIFGVYSISLISLLKWFNSSISHIKFFIALFILLFTIYYPFRIIRRLFINYKEEE